MLLAYMQVQLIEQFDCFARPAKVNYNRNLQQATVVFSPLKSTACYFPKEVQLSINFYDGFQSQTYVFDNFSLTETQQIVMENIKLINDRNSTDQPKFSFLNISCLSHFTLLKVSSFAVQTSQMDQCFDQRNSRFQLQRQMYFFEVKLTQACQEEILQAHQFQIQFGSIANTREIDMSSSGSNCKYDRDTFLLRCEVAIDLTDQMQLPFIACKVVFYMSLNGIQHTAEIQFDNVQTGRIQGLFSGLELLFFENFVYLGIETDPDIAMQFTSLADAQADVALYRLTAQNKLTGRTQKFQREYPQFDSMRQSITFDCDSSECIADLKQIKEQLADFKFQFDVTLLADGRFSAIASQYADANIENSCVDGGYVSLQSGLGFCYVFYFKSRCRLQAGQAANVSAQFVSVTSGKIQGAQFQHEIMYDGENKLCSSFPDREHYDQLSRVGSDLHVKVTYQQGDVRVIGYFTKHFMHNYNTTIIVVSLLGAAIIILSIFDSIQKAVLFIRITKIQKAKRK